MRNLHASRRRIALLVLAGLSCAAFQGQAKPKQRGLKDVTPEPAATALSPVGPYYALVIGNNNYQQLNKLKTAVNDARDVAQILQDRFGFETKVLYDATRSQILEAIDSYRGLPEKSNLVIYYAGHGWKDTEAARAYWLPVDAEQNQRPNWINSTDITDGIHAIPSRHILVISDSCFSGDLTMRSAGAVITSHEHNAMLAKLLSMRSRHIMSSGSDEPVADVGSGGHSVFAAALIESLKDMEGDSFTAEALLSERVKPRVAGRSAQTPQYAMLRDSNNDLGDFVFFRSKNNLPSHTATKSSDAPVAGPAQGDNSLPSHTATKSADAPVAGMAHGDNSLTDAKRYYAAKQFDRALPLFQRIAQSGNGEAAKYLGRMYFIGQGGLVQDYVQAAFWYRKAADAGDASGMTELGRMYELGKGGLAKDHAQAVTWYRKAAEAGNPAGMTNLGHMYEGGRGGLPKDEAQAVMWYRKAAEAGEPAAMTDLGHMYENGLRGLDKDDAQAVIWYQKAADAGNALAMFRLAHAYANGLLSLAKDDVQAANWYRKAADAGNADAMNNLAIMYANGRGGLPKDDTQAVSWYRKAADGGDGIGMSNLGVMYESGRGGLPKDDTQAVSWYRKAADAGERLGMTNLGLMYEKGRGGLPKDQAQAVYWFRKAADLGDERAQQALERLGIKSK
jgi:TPR repeat protein